jgi:L-rhamnose isomerase/sugar isomerase
MREIYAAIPDDWRLFIEHKMYEPAFYSTVISDWGTSYYCARELGDKASCLVDLGHHAPNVNIEQIVSRLIQFGKLGGFHFNDSKYGDDDLDAGSVKPFQLFLIFNELVDAESIDGFDPSYMLDQSKQCNGPDRVAGHERRRSFASLCSSADRRPDEAGRSTECMRSDRGAHYT